ncbi:hypothetical protein H072_3989 [Dactylellina haptotyla CBS 200.50]|uniref:DNA topoisomerase (ATP-hydrolyzing) n=1 Tax=Dactylellina haptotyla (strain CBS 200.50) TaxID=1284197 RepID=S8C2W9_DACHA|nr:hypothetical protein H072_3989 [Dactylellina haptotyla CBS 200.50]
MASDPDETALSSVIDLYQDGPTAVEEDIICDYFGWDDDVNIRDDLAQYSAPGYSPSPFPTINHTQLDMIPEELDNYTSSSPRISENTETQASHREESIYNEPSSSSVYDHDIATHNEPQLPHHINDAANTVRNSPTDPTADLQFRLYKLLTDSRTDEEVTINWEEADNSSRPSAWILEKIDEVFCAWMDVITNKSAFVRILELIAEAIKLDKIYTKRDVAIFRSQQTVNNLVDDISIALGVPRRTLHITAAAKGLVCGDLKILKLDNSTINCNIIGEGVLVPTSSDIKKVKIGDCNTVLIIEKEAIFRTLTESGDWRRLPGRPILLCGKGYPDIATREFARYLYLNKNAGGEYLDFYCLVDYDPHGLDIYTMYKRGSLLIGGSTQYDQMAVPSLRHLGVKFSDILDYCCSDSSSAEGKHEQMIPEKGNNSVSQNIERESVTFTNRMMGEEETQQEELEPISKRPRRHADGRYRSSPPRGLLLMTAHDRTKAISMLHREHDEISEEYVSDLRKLLVVGYKAEIQVLGDQLVRYLDEKLRDQRIGYAT